jgi:hypothetical protein
LGKKQKTKRTHQDQNSGILKHEANTWQVVADLAKSAEFAVFHTHLKDQNRCQQAAS